MKGILFFCIAFSCILLVFSHVEPLQTSPAFLWSNTRFLSGQNIQVSNVVSLYAIGDSLMGSPSVLSPFFTQEIPEVIFVFVEPKLSTKSFVEAAGSRNDVVNGGKFANLKKLVETSVSSMVLPYVNTNYGGNSFVESFTRTATLMNVAKFQESLLLENWSIKTNHVTDIVIVELDNSDYVAHDNMLAEVDTRMKSSSYAAVLLSAAVPTSDFARAFPVFMRLSNTSNNGSNSTNGTTTDNMWPDGIVEALIIMAPFLGLLAFGICCTFNLQSDLRFEGEKQHQKRQ